MVNEDVARALEEAALLVEEMIDTDEGRGAASAIRKLIPVEATPSIPRRRITDRERTILKAMKRASGHISDDNGRFYLVGGHGNVPLRHDSRTLPRMEAAGLIARKGSTLWEITELGKAAVFQLFDEGDAA